MGVRLLAPQELTIRMKSRANFFLAPPEKNPAR
jgi:hypothetical protein